MAKLSVWTKNGEWRLDEKHWVAQGGEADIYKKDSFAVKIYKDADRGKKQGLEERVSFAKKWQGLSIAAPLDVTFNTKKEAIGIVLPWLNGTPILTAFNNDWRAQNSFDDKVTFDVVRQLYDIVTGVHKTGALMVDGNEWNYMLDAHKKAWAIDADSWEIPGFKATARMPSIEDVHTPGVTEGSDWFAWAIVTFQLWVGIHPYKGVHPDFKRGALRSRMEKNVSIFHADVRVPSTTRPLSDIPPSLRAWYYNVFESGLRTAPPEPATWSQVATAVHKFKFTPNVTAGSNIDLTPVKTQAGMLPRGDALFVAGNWLTWEGKPLPKVFAAANSECKAWEAKPQWFIAMHKTTTGWCLTDESGQTVTRDGIKHAWRQNGLLMGATDAVVEQWDARKIHNGWHLHTPWTWTIPAGWRQDNNVRYWNSLGAVCALWSNGVAGRIERFPQLDGKKIRNWRQEGAYALVVVEENSVLELWVWNPDVPGSPLQKHIVDDANITSAHVGDMLMYWVDDNEGIIRSTHAAEALRGNVQRTTQIVGTSTGFYGLLDTGLVKISKTKPK